MVERSVRPDGLADSLPRAEETERRASVGRHGVPIESSN
jgi:hypothetical protein